MTRPRVPLKLVVPARDVLEWSLVGRVMHPRKRISEGSVRDPVSVYMEEVGKCQKDDGKLALAFEDAENHLWATLLQNQEVVKLVLSRAEDLNLEERPPAWIAFEKAARSRAHGKPCHASDVIPILRLADADRDLMNASVALTEASRPSKWQDAVGRAVRLRLEARKRFIKSHLRLVISVARMFIMRGVPISDLIQDGNIGLMKAVDRFDPHRGFKFSTYATWWIRHEVSRGIADKGKIIRIPVHVQDSVTKVRRLESSNEGMTDEEMASAVGITVDKASMVRGLKNQIFSLDAPVGDLDGATHMDMIEDGNPTPAQRCEDGNLAEKIRKMMASRLTPVEMEILRKRFGFDGEEMTLKEIGDERNLSRERIRQIESQALDRLLKSATALVKEP